MSKVINLYCHTLLVDAMVIYVPFSDATFFSFCFCVNIEKHKSNKNTQSLLKLRSLSIVTMRPIYIYVGLPRTPTPYNDLFLGGKYNVYIHEIYALILQILDCIYDKKDV